MARLITLLVIANCPACQKAETIWRAAASEHGWRLEVQDIESEEAAGLAQSLDVRSLPALVIDGRVVAVGTPDPARARALLVSLGTP